MSIASISGSQHQTRFQASEHCRWIPSCVMLLLLSVAAVPSRAQTFTTLVNFDDLNGAYPYFMVQGKDGTLRGTTSGTGPTYCGTAFGVSPGGALSTVTMRCSINFPDGNDPQGLIQGTDGNFYGVTFFGGANEEGSVFKLTPKGVLSSLVSFDGSNGSGPVGTLTEGTDGNFYGATYRRIAEGNPIGALSLR
jgi:uncharacterized repeat protein (TIGR03803 family)